MKENYIPGQGCKCHAHSEAECGCDVDWTPREVYELRATISDLETRHAATMLHTQSIVDEANEVREQRDRLAEELKEAQDAIEMMLKDSACRRIPAYAEEQLTTLEGGRP